MKTGEPQEFHYRIPRRGAGWRQGAHRGSSLGMGQEFVSHRRLYDWPDPRRLDLRASLRDVRSEWLVRVNRQRVSVPVQVIVDVSASMSFGSQRRKLQVAADFVAALGQSAFRLGDPLGMFAFDRHAREDLFVPPLLSRGAGGLMAAMLTDCEASTAGSEGLEEVALNIAGRQRLVFLLSDFHWPVSRLASVLEMLAASHIVPMVIWDPAELKPPAKDVLLPLADMESGAHRTLWMRPRLRAQWGEAVDERRAQLTKTCEPYGTHPFFVCGSFDSDAMSRYFFEAVA
jgi:VWA domain-containing protein